MQCPVCLSSLTLYGWQQKWQPTHKNSCFNTPRFFIAHIRGLAVLTDVWLRTSQTEISAELEAVCDDALYKSTFTLLHILVWGPAEPVSNTGNKQVKENPR